VITNRDRLIAIIELINEISATFDRSYTLCEWCGDKRWNNYPEHMAAERFSAWRRKTEKLLKESEADGWVGR